MNVAITGGIGSGKSFVCKSIARRGIAVYDCDQAAKRLMCSSPYVRGQLSQLIGDVAYHADGTLNKQVVTRFLLASEHNRHLINAIVHPAVANDFIMWQPVQTDRRGLKVMECALLFESGFDRFIDLTICVTAPLETRIARIMRRDGLTRSAALEWIERQMPQETVAARCGRIIVNDGVADIEQQLDDTLNFVVRNEQ